MVTNHTNFHPRGGEEGTIPTNRRIVLAERPEGAPTESTLTLKTVEVPSPQEEEMLPRT